MSDTITNDAVVKFIYFQDEEVSHQETIFEGTVSQWRDKTGKEWDGFDEGDSFLLNEDRVRVFSVSEDFDTKGQIIGAIYYVGSKKLNPNRIKYNNLKHD